MTDATSPRFEAAPLPVHHRLVMRAGAAALGAFVVYLLVVARGSGVTDVLLVVLAIALVPALWHLGMVPESYSVEPGTVRVHRRWLPDSRFRAVGPPQRLYDPDSLVRRPDRPAPMPGGIVLPGRRGRVYRASTDVACAVTVPVPQGTLLLTPAEPEAFLQAAQEELR